MKWRLTIALPWLALIGIVAIIVLDQSRSRTSEQLTLETFLILMELPKLPQDQNI